MNFSFANLRYMADLDRNFYELFIHTFRRSLADFSINCTPSALRAQQRDHVDLAQIHVGSWSSSKTSVDLKVRCDSLYLVGYRDSRRNQWYEFSEQGGVHLIPGSTFLQFGGSYEALQRAASKSIAKIPIGRKPLEQAIYDLTAETPEATKIARALIIMIQMFCEAARFTALAKAIWEHYETNDDSGFYPSRRMTTLYNSWGRLSQAVLENYPNLFTTISLNVPGLEDINTVDRAKQELGLCLQVAPSQPRMVQKASIGAFVTYAPSQRSSTNLCSEYTGTSSQTTGDDSYVSGSRIGYDPRPESNYIDPYPTRPYYNGHVNANQTVGAPSNSIAAGRLQEGEFEEWFANRRSAPTRYTLSNGAMDAPTSEFLGMSEYVLASDGIYYHRSRYESQT